MSSANPNQAAHGPRSFPRRFDGFHTRRAGLTRSLSCEDGAVAPALAILFATVMLAAAVAVEHNRIITEMGRDQRAVDAAVLAAADRLGMDDQESAGQAVALAFYAANRKPSTPSTLGDVTFDADTGEVSATTNTTWHATLLRSLEPWFPGAGQDRTLNKSATVSKGSGSVELALVLDNSGSMQGQYIEDLRTAASNLLATVFAGVDGTDRVKVGVIPFAASVNVGAVNKNASWIDGAGQAPTHFENVSESRTRFQLFEDLGTNWAGCVEARAAGLDVTDAEPVSGSTLFVPMFAVDEPGDAGSNSLGYTNSYLDDDGGTCEPYHRTCLNYSRRGKCTEWQVTRLPNAEAQARTCKYSGELPQYTAGPNAMCTTQPLLPLNSTKSEVEAAVTAMQANGNTNIKEGVAWGWRVLSPGAPFTEGREFGSEDNRKIMILMTDGENFLSSAGNHNKSIYAAQGYAAKGRLGTTYNASGYTSYLAARTRDACANAKAAGITIYTVAFRLENDPTTQALLRDCASDPDNAFTASDGSGLIQSFRNIGREISSLRISG
ncbi:MAG: VWA domain-containing protein [Hyphomicrobiaceae bacterium]|nr:VWA domain-containing protein [Hyphomicrobiaceae bacterium]